MSDTILALAGVSKTYKNGFEALKGVDLTIRRGEIFALLGPNGAGKTTLISAVCGIVSFTRGTIRVGGHDNRRDYKAARAMIGLVPQELTTDAFETVWDTVSFTRGLFGKGRDDAVVERTLRDLSLWEKKDSRIMTLSGGMKRRVLIAKALAHEPELLFLDEPTAGVDVALRRDMWAVVRRLRENGTTIILTTHYIEEAEEMADRVGVIARGELLLVEEKNRLMEKLGHKRLILTLDAPLSALPPGLAGRDLVLGDDGATLVHTYDTNAPRTGIATLIADLSRENIRIRDLETRQSSLEDIFVGLVSDAGSAPKEARP